MSLAKKIEMSMRVPCTQIDRFVYRKKYNIVKDGYCTNAFLLLDELILHGPSLLRNIRKREVVTFTVHKVDDKYLRIYLNSANEILHIYTIFVLMNGMFYVEMDE